MLVVVIAVGGVAVAIMQVVRVVAMGDGDVAAAFAVGVPSVIFGGDVLGGFTLVPVAFVLAVDVAIVEVVGVVTVGDGDMAAALAVGVRVGLVDGVGAHGNSLGVCPVCFQYIFIKPDFQLIFNRGCAGRGWAPVSEECGEGRGGIDKRSGKLFCR